MRARVLVLVQKPSDKLSTWAYICLHYCIALDLIFYLVALSCVLTLITATDTAVVDIVTFTILYIRPGNSIGAGDDDIVDGRGGGGGSGVVVVAVVVVVAALLLVLVVVVVAVVMVDVAVVAVFVKVVIMVALAVLRILARAAAVAAMVALWAVAVVVFVPQYYRPWYFCNSSSSSSSRSCFHHSSILAVLASHVSRASFVSLDRLASIVSLASSC